MPYYVNSTVGDDPGIDQFEPGFGAGLGAAIESTWEENPGALLWDAGELRQANAIGRPRLTRQDAEARVKQAGVALPIPESGYTQDALDILIRRRQDQMARQTILDRTPWSWIGTPVRGAAMLLTGALDPLNVASAFVPVFGEARVAGIMARAGEGALARAGARAQIGAIEGAAGALMLEPFVYGLHGQLADDYGMADSLVNLAFGAALGAGLHTGVGAIGDISRRSPPATSDVEAAQIISEARASVRAEAEAGSVARAIEGIDADTREAAFRIAMADVLQGREPDVSPLFDALGPQPLSPEVAARIDALVAEREALLPVAGDRADPRQVAAMREELALMEQRRPPDLDDAAAAKERAKVIQAQEGVSYKKALAEAKRQIADERTTFDAQQRRVNEAIERSAMAQQADDRATFIDREIAALEAMPRDPFRPRRTAVADAAAQASMGRRVQSAVETANQRAADPASATSTADIPASAAAQQRLDAAPADIAATAVAQNSLNDAMMRLERAQRVLADRGLNSGVDMTAFDLNILRAQAVGRALQDVAACRLMP